MCLAVALTALWWLGHESYSRDGPISVTDLNQDHSGLREEVRQVGFLQGMTLQEAVRLAGYDQAGATTHTAFVWRWSTWNLQRAVNKAVLLVRDGLRLARLESVEGAWQNWISRSVLTSDDYDQMLGSDEIWQTELRPGDQIVLGKK